MIRTHLPRKPGSAGVARRFVEQHLLERGFSARLVDLARLVSSELVTNACKYGEGSIELRLGERGERIRIEVIDEGSAAPEVREHDPLGVGGWGLRIVDQVSAEWGVLNGTTHVWAELPVS